MYFDKRPFAEKFCSFVLGPTKELAGFQPPSARLLRLRLALQRKSTRFPPPFGTKRYYLRGESEELAGEPP